jgi:4-diphosphocytidyl-2C-methyl-D-erythritol kinase
MQRERYGVVKDERDAYHELQDQFSAQLDMAFQQVEISSQEKDQALAELVKAKKVVADAEYFIKKLGTLVGVI